MSKAYKVNKRVFISSPFYIHNVFAFQVFGSRMCISVDPRLRSKSNCILRSVTARGPGALNELESEL